MCILENKVRVKHVLKCLKEMTKDEKQYEINLKRNSVYTKILKKYLTQ